MVARPQLGIVIERMALADLPAVQAIERDSFTTPWPPHAYRTELETNRLAHYIVARAEGEVIGFAGMWLMVDEAHVTTFAVRRDWRRQGVGERLLLALIDLAKARGAHEATLEVRPSNTPARRLYEKYGFRPVGVRPRYYSDNNEDALIMTTEPLEGRAMKSRLERLRAEIGERAAGMDRTDERDDGAAGSAGSAGSSAASSGDGPSERFSPESSAPDAAPDPLADLPLIRRRIPRRRP